MAKLHLFMNRERLGEIDLLDNKGSMGLSYDPAWLEAKGFAVSPHLPPGASQPDQVRRFLQNLLPEGEFLEELSISTACSKANVFGLIAEIGAETAGALSFSPDDSADPPPTSFREIPLEELTDRIAARKTVSIAMWDEKPRLSVAGVQAKLPVLIRPDGVMGFGEGDLASTHLLKLGRDPELHLVVNEYLCMKLAAAAGLPVAGVTLERFGEPVLSVRRFDRQWREGKVERLHLIDGCQMLDLSPNYKYERPFGKNGHAAGLRTGASLPLLFTASRGVCSVPAAAIKGLLDWALFQLVIGNSDSHGKNISFFVGRTGITLAPAYDLLCLDLYDYDRDLAMAIGDCFDPVEVGTYQLAEMCEECGVSQRQAAKSLSTLCGKILHALQAVHIPGATPEERDFAERIKTTITARAERLQRFTKDLPKIEL
ncbi:MAG TPA: hypothetical protein DCZ75_12985 [Geobacter sp.]|nr:hypothetical protein [Geobacter sp.]